MSRTFDYGGSLVSASHPVKALKTVKKTLLIDSADRDTTKYYTNGDFVVYLPRVYENVVSMRLAAAEFPPIINTGLSSVVSTLTASSPSAGFMTVTVASTVGFYAGNTVLISTTSLSGTFTIISVPSATTFTVASTVSGTTVGTSTPLATIQSGGSRIHNYVSGQNLALASANWSADLAVTTSYPNTYYFLVDIEGLNKVDETTVAGLKSTFSDSFYAKIPALCTSYGGQSFIEYNDHTAQENIGRYSPAVGKVDRLHIRTRLHSQQDRNGFIYWTNDGAYAGSTTNNMQKAEFNLTLEIEYLDNVFDDFSSLETHLTDRR